MTKKCADFTPTSWHGKGLETLSWIVSNEIRAVSPNWKMEEKAFSNLPDECWVAFTRRWPNGLQSASFLGTSGKSRALFSSGMAQWHPLVMGVAAIFQVTVPLFHPTWVWLLLSFIGIGDTWRAHHVLGGCKSSSVCALLTPVDQLRALSLKIGRIRSSRHSSNQRLPLSTEIPRRVR